MRANYGLQIGDLHYAEEKPPDNVLFVCKLNPVTTEEDLEIIFSRFGPISGCEVIKDKKTGASLQYAFVEFEKVAISFHRITFAQLFAIYFSLNIAKTLISRWIMCSLTIAEFTLISASLFLKTTNGSVKVIHFYYLYSASVGCQWEGLWATSVNIAYQQQQMHALI